MRQTRPFLLALVFALIGLWFAVNALAMSAHAQSDDTNFTNVRVERDFRLQPAQTITATAGMTLTARGSYQPLAASGAVTLASIAPDVAGTVLVLTNVTTPTITVSDAGAVKLGGARALGQFDTLQLISDGQNWLELAYANN